MVKRWIQKSLKEHKHGALHRQLGISQDEVISIKLLEEIKETPVNRDIYLGSKVNSSKEWLKVTTLLKRRAQLALNLRRLNK